MCFMIGLDQKERNFCDISTLLEAPQVDILTNCQQTYVQNRTRFAKVASYETSQETSVSTQLVVLYAPFQFGSE